MNAFCIYFCFILNVAFLSFFLDILDHSLHLYLDQVARCRGFHLCKVSKSSFAITCLFWFVFSLASCQVSGFIMGSGIQLSECVISYC